MEIENMPFCCTSAILGSFGEHGEKSLVTGEEIHRLIKTKAHQVLDLKTREVMENGKRCVMAISVNPENIKLLEAAGFKVVDKYRGIQGMVHIMTFHVGDDAHVG